MYREFFQLSGCEVVEAIDGREALAEALARPPALVIAEIRLPFIDGYALCEILRRDHATARIPILVVTSEGRTATWPAPRRPAPARYWSSRQRRSRYWKSPHVCWRSRRRCWRQRPRLSRRGGGARPPVQATNVEVAGPHLDDHASADSAAGSLSVVRPSPDLPAQPHRRRQCTAVGAVGLVSLSRTVRNVPVPASDAQPASACERRLTRLSERHRLAAARRYPVMHPLQ